MQEIRRMHLYETIVIYFAAGSPLAVLSLTRRYTGVWLHDVGSFLFELVFWLPLVVIRGITALRDTPDRANSARARPARPVRGNDPAAISRLRVLLDDLSGRHGTLELRSDIERFLSLYDESMIRTVSAEIEPSELFTIAGNSYAATASICLSRRNASRIEEHRDRALADLRRSLKRHDIRAIFDETGPVDLEFQTPFEETFQPVFDTADPAAGPAARTIDFAPAARMR